MLFWILDSCEQKVTTKKASSVKEDSAKVVMLLRKGNDIYAQRRSMSDMGESLLYFDFGCNVAERIGDSAFPANILYFIGNVYNA